MYVPAELLIPETNSSNETTLQDQFEQVLKKHEALATEKVRMFIAQPDIAPAIAQTITHATLFAHQPSHTHTITRFERGGHRICPSERQREAQSIF